MMTVMFVEIPENKGRMVIGYHLTRYNYDRAPEGLIRIARYPHIFWLENNHGYYGDIYMKQFIRKWKKTTYENIQRRKDRANAEIVMNWLGFVDIDNLVLEFL